jgi:hypothetical protein
MDIDRRIISIATWGLLLGSATAPRFISTRAEPVACTLLGAADASKALEVQSLAGKENGMGPTGCMWSNDPAMGDTSRKVALNTHTVRAFGFAKNPAIKTITIEPVSGIGDEAFYQIYPNDQSPFIWVRKGDVTFSIRILTRLKPKPFTLEQEKAKESVLAKAALARIGNGG